MLRAIVIQDHKGRFRDLGDVLKIARALGKQIFKTEENIRVIRVFGPDSEIGYVAVVEGPRCSKPLVVREGRKKEKNE